MTGGFDATTVAPEQSAGSKHPLGNYQAQVTDTSIEESQDKLSGMFVVEFTTPNGTIKKRYGLWHSNPQTVEIANKQLSALCHATGIFRVQWENEGAALRGARCAIEVGDQLAKDPSNPTGPKIPNGYVEVKKVFDTAGNEPGKASSQAQQPAPQQQPQGQPLQQGATGGWTQPNQQTTAQQPANGGWAQGGQAANNVPAQQQQPQQAAQGWTQQQPPPAGGAGDKPAWAK